MSVDYTTFDVYFASICSFQFHPGVKSRVPLDELAEYAMQAVHVRDTILSTYGVIAQFCPEVVMANPFDALVKMVQQRVERQEQALAESKLQLGAAIAAQAAHQDGDKAKQADLVSEALKVRK